MKRNKYIGKWEEEGWTKIDLDYQPDNLKFLLEKISLSDKNEFTHQDVANWCEKFWLETLEGSLKDNNGEFLRKASDISEDISAQWELYLVNTYSIEELQTLDFSKVRLPREWFVDWLKRLNEV